MPQRGSRQGEGLGVEGGEGSGYESKAQVGGEAGPRQIDAGTLVAEGRELTAVGQHREGERVLRQAVLAYETTHGSRHRYF